MNWVRPLVPENTERISLGYVKKKCLPDKGAFTRQGAG